MLPFLVTMFNAIIYTPVDEADKTCGQLITPHNMINSSDERQQLTGLP